MTIDALPGRARRTRSRKEARRRAGDRRSSTPTSSPARHAPGRSCRRSPLPRLRHPHHRRRPGDDRASSFIAGGLVVGLIVGTAVTGAVALVTRPAAVDRPHPGRHRPEHRARGARRRGGIRRARDPGRSDHPAGAVSALRQSSGLQQRLADDAGRLAAALAVADPSSVDLARILRSLAPTPRSASGVATQVGSWSTAAALSTQLTSCTATSDAPPARAWSCPLPTPRAYVRPARRRCCRARRPARVDAAARPLAGRGRSGPRAAHLPDGRDALAVRARAVVDGA